MIHLKSIHLNEPHPSLTHYPFNVPVIRSLQQMDFTNPVTFFVGENGSGKSTLLEALAASIGSIRVGDKGMDNDEEMQPARDLAKHLKLAWSIKMRKGLFLRAEDFITYTKQLSSIRKEMEAELVQVKSEYQNRSILAQRLAALPYKRSIVEMETQYEGNLEHKSHGKSFLQFFQARFQPKGLYLLDEPETPLSPLKQIAFISLIKEMVDQDAQFIIATHSPIIMAYPGATIYSFDQAPLTKVHYDQLEHVKLTRDFLNTPEQFLRHL